MQQKGQRPQQVRLPPFEAAWAVMARVQIQPASYRLRRDDFVESIMGGWRECIFPAQARASTEAVMAEEASRWKQVTAGHDASATVKSSEGEPNHVVRILR
jgi:hypothetical protein